jgi:O-antigen ligase
MTSFVLGLIPFLLMGLPWVVRYPLRTILPVYAATVPISNIVTLDIPLPPPFNTLSSLLGALAIIACFSHLMLYREGRVPNVSVGLWLLFLGWISLTSFWALDSAQALDRLLIATPLIVLLMAVSTVSATSIDLDALRTAIILSGIAVGGYAIVLLFSGRALPSYGVEERLFLAADAGTTDPNILAASLLLPLALSVERILLGGKRWWGPAGWRFLGMVGAFSVFAALFLTGSRGGLAAGFAAFLLTLVGARHLPDARPWIRRTIVAVVTIALAGPAVFAITQFLGPRDRPTDLLASAPIERLLNPTAAGTSGRAEIWAAGFLACRVHCAVGSGLDNFSAVFDERYAFSSAGKNLERGQAAHNLYLALAVEVGLVGLTLFILALIAEWRAMRAPPAAASAPGLRAGMIAILLANVFLSAIWFKYFWLVFAVNRVAEGSLEPPNREPRTQPPGGLSSVRGRARAAG